METAGLRFMQRRRAGIAADEEGRRVGKRAVQLSNCLDPSLATLQSKIRNDQIRQSPLIEEARKGAAARSTDDAAPPTA